MAAAWTSPRVPISASVLAPTHVRVAQLIRAYWSPLASTGGRYLYSGSACGSVFLFDALTGHIAAELRHHSGVVRDASWHPDASSLVSVSWDGSVCQWGRRRTAESAAVKPPTLTPDWWGY